MVHGPRVTYRSEQGMSMPCPILTGACYNRVRPWGLMRTAYHDDEASASFALPASGIMTMIGERVFEADRGGRCTARSSEDTDRHPAPAGSDPVERDPGVPAGRPRMLWVSSIQQPIDRCSDRIRGKSGVPIPWRS